MSRTKTFLGTCYARYPLVYTCEPQILHAPFPWTVLYDICESFWTGLSELLLGCWYSDIHNDCRVSPWHIWRQMSVLYLCTRTADFFPGPAGWLFKLMVKSAYKKKLIYNWWKFTSLITVFYREEQDIVNWKWNLPTLSHYLEKKTTTKYWFQRNFVRLA